jgi:putative hydrolase of the HAD superfamily
MPTSLAITAVTIDLWNTLLDSSNGPGRERDRRAAIVAELGAHGFEPAEERIGAASLQARDYFQHHWLTERRTPTARELVDVVVRELDAELPGDALDRLAEAFARGVLDHPPALLPGAAEALGTLAESYRLAIVSDTAFSPGAVLRELMARHAILDRFDAFVFSDETGVAKPEPAAFERALADLGAVPGQAVHIGDIERTDISGARAVGMRAILYRNDDHRHALAEDETEADAVVGHWDEVPAAIQGLAHRAGSG